MALRFCSLLCSLACLQPPPSSAGAGVLGQELWHAGGSQVEFYTLEYAAALAPHGPTWPLAAAYLAWCPAHGQAALETLLRRLPLEAADAWPARKAAELAAFHGLSRVAEGGRGWMCLTCKLLLPPQQLLLSSAAETFVLSAPQGCPAVVVAPCAARNLLRFGYPPSRLHLLPAADIQRCQGVLCWQAGMVGAALSWLARCDDVGRIDLALRPLADAVSAGRLEPTDSAALAVLQPVLEALPAGSANAALLAVHRLLEQGQAAGSGSNGAGSMHVAVAALAQLPDSMRDSCLLLVCGVLPAMPPGALSEADVRYLLQWLLVSEDRVVPVGIESERVLWRF